MMTNPMQMLQMLRGKDPNAIMQILMQQNPNAAKMLAQMQNQARSNGMSAEQFAKQLAHQNGVSESDLMAMVNMLRNH